ncbi:MAG: ergothioneine biosynthesis protein EgtB [Alcanivorax sp.]|uniref:ergothioneine biosynthesis protein EgtB n=1 Tax=Alcanivorax sp. TaxID=1872427 RepID=UPI003DA7376C
MPDTARQDACATLMARYQRIRAFSEQLCDTLLTEDMGLQACADVSPPRWHLAHTTWFFETFLLKPNLPGYRVFEPQFEYLFNSYYNGIGEQFARPQRHLLSRPTGEEVHAWRQQVDQAMARLIEAQPALSGQVTLGLNHEQQHQELLLTDLKYSLSFNPLAPIIGQPIATAEHAAPLSFQSFSGGLVEIGTSGHDFAFDNETPRHRVWLEPFALANRPVTNGEFRAFIEDGGYRRPELWLSDGWAWVQAEHSQRPLYWHEGLDQHFTLAGLQPLHPGQILAHVNYYEADAYARWAGKRLPTEQEWEHAAAAQPLEGHFVDNGIYQPGQARDTVLSHLFGDVWEWTASAYLPYPGFQSAAGAVGEYNGKFMCNQMVLRGGSCASSRDHLRASYRNFFYPHHRWQFSGIRLAGDPS